MYDQDYIIYGPAGIEEVKCLVCGAPVRILAGGTLTARDGRQFEVNRLMDLPTYRMGPDIKIIIEGNESNINPIICKDCVGKEINPERVLEQYKFGWLKSVKSDEERNRINNITLG
jgi:hypothetical protein